MAITIKSTKAELYAEVQRLEAETIARGKQLASLREQLSIATRNAPRAPRQVPLHFQAARETAMRIGRPVKVGE